MRILHTADWHLGRTLHGANLIDDQAFVLEQFVDLAKNEKPDVIIIAGDVYDRAVPPNEAITLLDETLCRLVLDLGIQVILIAGNHDSPARLAFGHRLLYGSGLHILGQPASSTAPVAIEDRHGPVHIYPLPYAEPAIVRHCTDKSELQGHQEAMKCLLDGIWSRHPKGVRSIAVAHCFVTGSTECESERPLSIGGAGVIEPTVFKGFSYVALGHLHRPQACDHGRIRYSGSLLQYSFAEADHSKAILFIDMDSKGDCDVKEIVLTPRRQVRCLRGELAQILAGAMNDKAGKDYLTVTLLDQGPIFDAMGKLREVYPNVLHIERPVLQGRMDDRAELIDHRRMGDLDLFAAFFEHVTGDELAEEHKEAFIRVVDKVRRDEREGLA